MKFLSGVLLTTTLLLASLSSYAQKLSAADGLKLMTVNENINLENYDEAMRLLKEIHKNAPNNAEINFKMGISAYMLNRPEESLVYLMRAQELDSAVSKELNYWLGRSQHKNGLLDDAMVSFEKFRATLKGKNATTHIVNEHIHQLEMAKKLISMPVDVKIRNLGQAINSEYKESNPSISADGNTLIFTTCRPENTGGKIDPNFGIYYQDIWESVRDSVTGEWTDASPVYGQLNTEWHDANTSISPDGSVIFVYKSVGGGDIYYSRIKKNGEWRTPEPLGGKANSSYFETGACITPDKKKLFFISERIKHGEGNGDIWMAKRTGKWEYGEAQNLGSVVNSIDDENSVFIHPDGKTLYFSSNSKNSIGGYDIFRTELIDGKWTKPVNLGYPINTLGDEMHFVLSTDGTKAYVTSKRDDTFGDFDIYEIDMTNYKVPSIDGSQEGSASAYSGPPIGIIRGKVIDKTDAEPLEVKIIIYDAESGTKVNDTETNEGGEYFVTVEAGKKYNLVVKESSYAEATEMVEVPAEPGKTPVVVKAFFLSPED